MAEPTANRAAPLARAKRIAVAGNPNSGKTSIFNQLTGLRQRVANYPGVTVEKREGRLAGTDVILLDLPGAYSLSARSPDEEIARDVLLGRVPGLDRPDAVLLVIDANNLERNLYLVSQVMEFGTPVVIACNMMDVAARRGVAFRPEALSKILGVPVIGTVASEGRGIDDLRRALTHLDGNNGHRRPWPLPVPFEDALPRIESAMVQSGAVPADAVRGGALLWLVDYLSGEGRCLESAERFLSKLAPEHAEALRSAAESVASREKDPAAKAIEHRYAWISSVVSRLAGTLGGKAKKHPKRITATDRIDHVLTHRVYGLLVFAAVMFLLFLSIFSWAEPVMNLIEAGQTALASWVGAGLDDGPIRSLITDGIIAGVGAVVVFFPQICILFLFLSILEDSGYMARAAFLMDRLMSRVGLHGKSFIPLLSCYACAIPGILSTRTIENRKDRFTTILIAPFISCSARLPVYVIVIAAVFGDRAWVKAIVMFSMYLLSTLTALGMALLLKRTLFAGPRPAFIMELPPYHLPQPFTILRTMWDRSKLFLTNAGTTIFAVCVIIWALSYFPHLRGSAIPTETEAAIVRPDGSAADVQDNVVAGAQLRHSLLGRLGHVIEPALKPLGFDWQLGIGILSSFLAREVFVSTMGITFSVGEADETSTALRDKLASATWPDGRIVLTPLTGVGLMVFYVLACQCISTLAVVRKETGSWRWPALMFGQMTVLAYLGALGVHQIGRLLGWG